MKLYSHPLITINLICIALVTNSYHKTTKKFLIYPGGGGLGLGCTIYLFICWNKRMAAPLLCYHSTAVCTSKCDISASAICYLWRLFISLLYRYTFMGFSCCYGGLSYILHSLCSLCCNMHSANGSEVVDYGHVHTLLWPSIFLCLFGSPLLGIGTTCTYTKSNQSGSSVKFISFVS